MIAIMTLAIFAGLLQVQPVLAASPFVKITSVKPDTSVTIQATGLPTGVSFKVRMDVSGTAAVNGILVGETKSDSSGKFDGTYNIPAELKGKDTITIRIDGTGGWYAYNWFSNKTQSSSGGSSTPTPTPTTTPKSYYIEVVAVKESKVITVKATGFPANTDYKVRIGPYYGFSKNNETMLTVNSSSDGNFRFNVNLPDMLKHDDLVTIRLDGPNKQHAYNAFKNHSTGVVDNDPTQTLPTNVCQIVSTTPTASMSVRNDFDAIWTVKNISNQNWSVDSVDYQYWKGEQIYKHESAYDFTKTVKPGETINIVVDMVAPNKAGTYTTHWAIASGGGLLCDLPLTITVK
jgi:hypothetical protein